MNLVEAVKIVGKEALITHDEAKRAATIQTPKDTNIDPVDIKAEFTERELKFLHLHLLKRGQTIYAYLSTTYHEYSGYHAYLLGRENMKKCERAGEAASISSDPDFGLIEDFSPAQGIKCRGKVSGVHPGIG
jgi:hypothetical protein